MAVVTKAIISAAGWGTRRLPITKTIDKAMLPIGNRPLIDYIVRDIVKAGISEIFVVVNKGSTQIRDYYMENERLNEFLTYNKKQDMLELVHPPTGVIFKIIEQDANGKYGTAIPPALVYQFIQKGESVVVVSGDDFVYNRDGSSEIKRMIESTHEGTNSMLSTTVPQDQVGRYGVIDFSEDTGAFQGVIERPDPATAPSNQINISKYLFNYDMLTAIYNYAQLDVSGEFYIIEPMKHAAIQGQQVMVIPAQGEFMDCGNVHGWLHANNSIVVQR